MRIVFQLMLTSLILMNSFHQIYSRPHRSLVQRFNRRSHRRQPMHKALITRLYGIGSAFQRICVRPSTLERLQRTTPKPTSITGRNAKLHKSNVIDDWLANRLHNEGNSIRIGADNRVSKVRPRFRKRVLSSRALSAKGLDISAKPAVLKVKFKPKLLSPGTQSFLRLFWGPSILRADIDPRLLSPTVRSTLLNIQAKPHVLYARFRPKVLSPEVYPSLAFVEWYPRLLRATFEPTLLSPIIYPNLLRIKGKTPRVLTAAIRPKLLSPNIDLQLYMIDPKINMLRYNYQPSLLSPTIRLHLLRTAPSVKLLTLSQGDGLLSPTISMG